MKKKRYKKFRVDFAAWGGFQRRWLIAGVTFFLAWMVLGGNKGVVSAVQSWQQGRVLRAEISRLEKENAALLQRRHLLKTDPQLYEKVAREDLGLVKPGELIYRFDTSNR